MSPGSSSHSSSGNKRLEHFDCCFGIQCAIGLRADLPAAPSGALQQEDIVQIIVWSDGAARACITYHQIVDAGLGTNEKWRSSSHPPGT